MPVITLPRPVKAVIFDMDGLLVDSERIYRDSMMHVTERFGRVLPLPVFQSMVGTPHAHSRDLAMAHFGADFDYEAWHEAVSEHAHAQIVVDLSLKAGVLELMHDLEAAGLPRAVATSSSHRTVALQLGPSGLLTRFQTIVANGDYAHGKPSPDPFLVAAERLGVVPEACLALEDSHNGVRAAHAAGMMTVMVPDLLDATDEMRALCVAIAMTLHDVRDCLAINGY